LFQIGSKAFITSDVSIALTGKAPNVSLAALSVTSHWRACFALRQLAR